MPTNLRTIMKRTNRHPNINSGPDNVWSNNQGVSYSLRVNGVCIHCLDRTGLWQVRFKEYNEQEKKQEIQPKSS